eukprot:jgi/Chrzof1/12738/Cz07g05230.t1
MACVQYKQAFRDTGRAEWQDVQPIVPQQPASSHTENYKQQITAAGDAGSVVTGKAGLWRWVCCAACHLCQTRHADMQPDPNQPAPQHKHSAVCP